VVTNRFIKIYDLSKDNICPTHYFTLMEDDTFKEATFVMENNNATMLVMSGKGIIYSQIINDVQNEGGPLVLTQSITGSFEATSIIISHLPSFSSAKSLNRTEWSIHLLRTQFGLVVLQLC
jgi:hypothetical protein